MSDNNFHIVTIPIAVIILSLVASAIWYLLSLGIIWLMDSEYFIGWSYFSKTSVIFFVTIFGTYIYEKLIKKI